MHFLSQSQQDKVNDMLRYTLGERCPLCGSTDIVSTGRYYETVSGEPSVQFVCQNQEATEHRSALGPFSVRLERYQARKVGLV